MKPLKMERLQQFGMKKKRFHPILQLFSLFLTNDLWKGLEDMLNQLSKKIASIEIIESDQTTFCLFHKNSLNRIRNTYDIAVIVKEFTLLNKQTKREGRE